MTFFDITCINKIITLVSREEAHLMPESLRQKLKVAGQLGRIGAHIVNERLRRPRPTTLAEIPPSVDALTPEWLTAALCRAHPGAWVTAVSTASGSDGSTSRRLLTIDYNDVGRHAGLPTSIFTKSTTEARRQPAGSGGDGRRVGPVDQSLEGVREDAAVCN